MKKKAPIIMFIVVACMIATTALAQNFDLRQSNPIRGVDDIGDVIRLIADRLFGIAVPIAVLMYIYAGVKLIISRGKPEAYREAGRIVLYTSIGLAIILIGEGFVSLIKSILSLG